MAKEPIPTNPSNDELEALAEHLFGVRLTEDQTDLGSFDVGEFDLDADDEPTAAEVDLEPDSEAISAEDVAAPTAGRSNVIDDDEFGASLLDEDDEPEPAPPIKEHHVSESSASSREPDQLSGETGDELPVVPVASAGIDEDDYWDALDGFEWEESEDKSSTVGTAYVDTPESFEDLSIESAEKTDEFLEDAEFGAGLDDDADDLTAPAVESSADKSVDEGERKGRRRRGGRRRGRRGRSRDPQTIETPGDEADDVPVGAAEEEEEEDDLEPGDADFAGDDETAVGDAFGAGLEVDGEDEDKPQKRRRRRGGRGRRGRKAGETGSAKTTVTDAREEEAEEDESDPTGKDEQRKYRSVPTWEEAIGYLVRPEPKKSGDGGKSGSGSRRGRRGRRRSSN